MAAHTMVDLSKLTEEEKEYIIKYTPTYAIMIGLLKNEQCEECGRIFDLGADTSNHACYM